MRTRSLTGAVNAAAEVLTTCPTCSTRIAGKYEVPGVVSIGESYEPPKFCDKCGAPFPWVRRKERIWELQNALEEESDLDEATKLWVSEQLALLQNLEFTDEKAQKRLWENLREHAPQLWKHERTQRIIDTLISAGVKSAIGGP
jgi:hypothetical protein